MVLAFGKCDLPHKRLLGPHNKLGMLNGLRWRGHWQIVIVRSGQRIESICPGIVYINIIIIISIQMRIIGPIWPGTLRLLAMIVLFLLRSAKLAFIPQELIRPDTWGRQIFTHAHNERERDGEYVLNDKRLDMAKFSAKSMLSTVQRCRTVSL